MKKVIQIFTFYIIVFSSSFSLNVTADDDTEKTYTKYFQNIFPGAGFDMPIRDFAMRLKDSNLKYSVSGSERVFFVDYQNKEFNQATFFFSQEVNPLVDGALLHKVELSFPSDTAALSFLNSNFGASEVQNGKMDWQKYDYESSYKVRAWQDGKKIVFFAALANVRLKIKVQQSKFTILSLDDLWNKQVLIIQETMNKAEDNSDDSMRFMQNELLSLKPITNKIYDFDSGLYFLTDNITKALEAVESCSDTKAMLLEHEKSLDIVYKVNANFYKKIDIFIKAESNLAKKFNDMINALNEMADNVNKFIEWYDKDRPHLPQCHQE